MKGQKIVCLFCIAVVILIISATVVILNKMNQMPQRVCHTEVNITGIILTPICHNFSWGMECFDDYYIIEDDVTDIICEDGVIDTMFGGGWFETTGTTPLVCIVTKTVEICEIQ